MSCLQIRKKFPLYFFFKSNYFNKCQQFWWNSLEQEDPITLEPLGSLAYPPFALYHRSQGGISYFDGMALASFIVARGIFQNPLTREELSYEDCRRLDVYLEEYCYHNKDKSDSHNNMMGHQRKVSVVEAFSLRNSVNVRNSDQSTVEAVEALRNTATVALAGLFVYGNNRHRRNSDDDQEQEQQLSVDPSLLDWGFDLSRTVENTSEYSDGHGFVVIDDDEAAVAATQQSAYQAVQEAFPPLHFNIDNNTHVGYNADTDEDFLAHVRSLSLQEQKEQEKRAQKMELARQKILREALERRDKRKKQLRIGKEYYNSTVPASKGGGGRNSKGSSRNRSLARGTMGKVETTVGTATATYHTATRKRKASTRRRRETYQIYEDRPISIQ